MLIKPKNKLNDQPLKFPPMGQKPQKKKYVDPDGDGDTPAQENSAADKAKDAKQNTNKKPSKNKKNASFFAKKAAAALVGGNSGK